MITGSRQDLFLRFVFLYIHYRFSLCLYSITHLRAKQASRKKVSHKQKSSRSLIFLYFLSRVKETVVRVGSTNWGCHDTAILNFILEWKTETRYHNKTNKIWSFSNLRVYCKVLNMRCWKSVTEHLSSKSMWLHAKPFPSVLLLWWHMVDSCIIKMY